MAERQDGSVLMLVPAAVLVLLVLAAIVVDSAIAFLGQRELTAAAAAAANDAATAAISERTFYRPTAGDPAASIEIDDDAARRVVEAAIAARAPRGVLLTGLSVRAPGRQVCVALAGEVEYLFAQALPGAPERARVEGRAVSTAVEGPAGTPVRGPTSC